MFGGKRGCLEGLGYTLRSAAVLLHTPAVSLFALMLPVRSQWPPRCSLPSSERASCAGAIAVTCDRWSHRRVRSGTTSQCTQQQSDQSALFKPTWELHETPCTSKAGPSSHTRIWHPPLPEHGMLWGQPQHPHSIILIFTEYQVSSRVQGRTSLATHASFKYWIASWTIPLAFEPHRGRTSRIKTGLYSCRQVSLLRVSAPPCFPVATHQCLSGVNIPSTWIWSSGENKPVAQQGGAGTYCWTHL